MRTRKLRRLPDHLTETLPARQRGWFALLDTIRADELASKGADVERRLRSCSGEEGGAYLKTTRGELGFVLTDSEFRLAIFFGWAWTNSQFYWPAWASLAPQAFAFIDIRGPARLPRPHFIDKLGKLGPPTPYFYRRLGQPGLSKSLTITNKAWVSMVPHPSLLLAKPLLLPVSGRPLTFICRAGPLHARSL